MVSRAPNSGSILVVGQPLSTGGRQRPQPKVSLQGLSFYCVEYTDKINQGAPMAMPEAVARLL
jgi:hypothetical protein